MPNKVYMRIASTLEAIGNCIKSGNAEWERRHRDRLERLVSNHFPSGSGFDAGTKLSDKSRSDRLVFETSFHHMNEAGMYDGWTEHEVIVTASLSSGFDLLVTGRNRNDIKEYIAETFQEVLGRELTEEEAAVVDSE